MDEKLKSKQIAALEKSIEKWDGIVKGTEQDLGGANCECCRQFYCCVYCPVANFANNAGCDNTPYRNFSTFYSERFLSEVATCAQADFINCAEAERDFLKEVLVDLKKKG